MSRKRSNNPIYDVITVLFVILTVVVGALFVLIINDPNVALNPFPPPTVPPIVNLPTLTPSATPTATPTATATPSITPTPSATGTATPTSTPTATATPTITPTQVLAGANGAAQPSAPPSGAATLPPLDDGSGNIISGAVETPIPAQTRSAYSFTVDVIRRTANPGEEGCQWLSIAGTVTGLMGEPLPGLAIEVEGENFRQVQFSGTASRWGESGFEFVVGAAPRRATYTIQIKSSTGGLLSDAIEVQTGNTCDETVTLVEFVQNHPY